jgi:hypothetical protein
MRGRLVLVMVGGRRALATKCRVGLVGVFSLCDGLRSWDLCLGREEGMTSMSKAGDYFMLYSILCIDESIW